MNYLDAAFRSNIFLHFYVFVGNRIEKLTDGYTYTRRINIVTCKFDYDICHILFDKDANIVLILKGDGRNGSNISLND